MPNSSRWIDFLEDILARSNYLIVRFQNVSYDEFLEDETLRLASERSIEIIGEAVKNLPDEIFAAYPEVSWREIARMRDRLIHRYFAIDYTIVWDVIQIHIPLLKSKVEFILNNRDTENKETK